LVTTTKSTSFITTAPGHDNDLTNLSSGPLAFATYVVGYETAFNLQQHVIFFGTNNRVDGAWHHNDLTLLTGTLTAVGGSPLDGYETLFNNQQHVNFQSFDGHVHELYYTDA
jgi:hypothetical protein